MLKRVTFSITLILTFLSMGALTPIQGERIVPVHEMWLFVTTHNPDFDPEIAQAFATVGDRYGIRGDIALCQAIIETGWFKYAGSAVTAENHNYCGMGVHNNGDEGCKFPTVEQGVTAMLQHLYAYCTKEAVPGGDEILDPRFSYVSRGSAQNWEDLSGRWAMNPNYGSSIIALYTKLLNYSGLETDPW